MKSLATYTKEKLQKSVSGDQLRILKESRREQGIYVIRNSKKLISFSCNDYLGLSTNPDVCKAATDAIEKYGTGSGASRLVTGNNPLYLELENLLAGIKSTESALVFGSGYLANLGIITTLASKGDLIIADRLVHASIIDGCQLSGAKLLRFKHNDVNSCNEILVKHRKDYKNCLIITDHIFSMDGDIAPVDELYDIAEKHDSWLMSDDAHGLGTILNNNKNKPHIQMGTLSKTVGSYGGYVCATKQVIDYLVNTARPLIYSTALPPATLAASIAALKIINSNKELCARPLQNARLFTSLLDIETAQSPIVPLILGTEEKSINASKQLEDLGFLVASIRPPTVPKGTSRLRFAFSALHNHEDIERIAAIIKERILHG